MTTQTEARNAIYNAFIADWTPTGHQLALDNEDFKPPDGGSWARLTVRHSASTQETLGRASNRKFSRSGSVFVQIFTDTNVGTRSSDNLATIARNAFEGKTLTGTNVFFRDVIVRESGVDGQWFQAVVEAEFEYEEIR